MISLLIPVYNTDVRDLVKELNRQLIECSSVGEIIVLDDFSEHSKEVNREISSLPLVFYEELPANLGRIAIRNFLAAKALYPYLLFLDGDSGLVHSRFVSNYIQAAQQGADVVVGGRIYTDLPPRNCAYRLHWKYGKKREVTFPGKKAFRSNNFLIRKEIFAQLSFPPVVSGYGHGDTWMGIQLEELGAKIQNINNPVLHQGIEPTEVFLRKTDHALNNLFRLSQSISTASLRRHVRLYRAFKNLQYLKPETVFVVFYKLFRKNILRNIFSCHPSLTLFDLYRLHQLLMIAKKNSCQK